MARTGGCGITSRTKGDVCDELVRFTLLTRERAGYLVDRYCERNEREPERLKAVAADIEFAERPS
jgi:arsenic resistance protein ArsH